MFSHGTLHPATKFREEPDRLFDIDNGEFSFYPAGYDILGIISVAATDLDDQLADFSNYGPISVDIAAPGQHILGCDLRRRVLYDWDFRLGDNGWSENILRGYGWTLDNYLGRKSIVTADFYGFPGFYEAFTAMEIFSPLIDLRNESGAILEVETAGYLGLDDVLTYSTQASGEDRKFGSPSILYPGWAYESVKRSLGELDGKMGYVYIQLFADLLAFGFSSSGVVAIDRVAVSVVDRTPDAIDAVRYNDGTSFATPIVSGVAAMIMSQNPQLTHLQVRQMILDSAIKVSGLTDKVATGAIINAKPALEIATPTPSPSPSPSPLSNLSILSGDFLGNFQSASPRGQVAVNIGKGGSFSGTILTPTGRVTFREKFSPGGQASVPVTSLQGTLSLSLKTSGLEDGKWDTGDVVFIEAVLRIGGEEISLVLRPAARKGGTSAPLVGSRINALFESLGNSGVDFGHGFAGAAVGKDGTVKISGSMADGTKFSGSARMVEDGVGGWKLPVAMPLASVKGFLHGEAAIDSRPSAEGFHLESEEPWTWIRPANSRAKAFPSGFTEELNVRGREWKWTKGTSALGGNSANFTLDLNFGNETGGFIPLVGVDGISGTLGASNKPVWPSTPPKGFTMAITPATGLVSGKVPGTLNGKEAILSYQGLIFPSDMELDSGTPVRGAGFISGTGGSGTMKMIVP